MKTPTNNLKIIPENNLRQFLILVILGVFMFFVRTSPIYHIIFTDWPGAYGKFVNFASDDAVYHMRLVHNTIQHFPWRVFFDPFTHFPFGNQIHFGPLFTLIIASVSLIVGLGNPSPELVNAIGAFTPPVMGVLCLIPLYFIAKNLSGKIAAIICALILAFLPGEFLQRSSLGFTDHHIAEVLFSTISCAFLITALNKIKNNRYFFRYALFSAIAFGLFILVWPAALMFGAIFLIFLITQLIIDHLKNNQTKYLLHSAIIFYSIPTIMVLPYTLINPHIELAYYSLTQPLILITMMAIFTIFYAIHRLCKYNQLTSDLYTLILAAILILIIFTLKHLAPTFISLINDGIKMLFEPTPGMKTVSEVHPSILGGDGNKFTIAILWHTYFWPMVFASSGLLYLFYRVYKNSRPQETFLLVWSIVIILAAFGQRRFNYYLAINVAILAGCYFIFPFFNFLGNLQIKRKLYANTLKAFICITFCFFMMLLAAPMLVLLIDKTTPAGPHVTREEYNTYIWLKTHTPDPQGKIINKSFAYTNGYYSIPKIRHIPYKYPKSAYGVMAWWDIGHQITYIAERIPNTNPFQQGIIEQDKTMGAAPFFTSTNEIAAIKNLQKTGSRYILIDSKSAINIRNIGIWNNDTKSWSKITEIKKTIKPKNYTFKVPIDSEKFLNSMINRLYYQDANGLKHFRLIYESGGNYSVILNRIMLEPHFHINIKNVFTKNYRTALKHMSDINNLSLTNKERTIFPYYARPPTKKIKIFEKVKGAIIEGEIPNNIQNNTLATITLKLKTKFNRLFTYQQACKIKNGKFKFIVPYPTTAMRGKDYNYDIKPTGNYQIKIGSQIIKVAVPETSIMRGAKINIDFKNNLN